MANSKKVKNLAWLREIQKEGASVKALDNMPTLYPEARFYWEAYVTLSSKRLRTSAGHMAIQVSELVAYTDYMRITDETLRDDLFYMVNVLDAVFLEYVQNLKPPKGVGSGAKAARKPARRR